jgi:hypothetical protein
LARGLTLLADLVRVVAEVPRVASRHASVVKQEGRFVNLLRTGRTQLGGNVAGLARGAALVADVPDLVEPGPARLHALALLQEYQVCEVAREA